MNKGRKHDIRDTKRSLGLSSDDLPISDTVYGDASTTISRENPNRLVSGAGNIVVGYDHEGTYNYIIPSGSTDNTWYYDDVTPRDSVSRLLLQFDLNESTYLNVRNLDSAVLKLRVSTSAIVPKTLSGITLDCYRFNSGAAAGFTAAPHGSTAHWDGDATWFEWKKSGAHNAIPTTTVGQGLTGNANFDVRGITAQSPIAPIVEYPAPIAEPYLINDIVRVPEEDNRLFVCIADHTFVDWEDSGINWEPYTQESWRGGTLPPPSGNEIRGNNWQFQGLGYVGGRGPERRETDCDTPGLTVGSFADYSAGQFSMHSDSEESFPCEFAIYPSIHIPKASMSGGSDISLVITDAVRDAVDNYGGLLRIMIKLRNDHDHFIGSVGMDVGEGTDNNRTKKWIAFVSSAAEGGAFGGGANPNRPNIILNFV